jgi:SAM-dependent methyltransferase
MSSHPDVRNLLPPGGRILAVGAESGALLDERDGSSIMRAEADQLDGLNERFDVVFLAGLLEHAEDPGQLVRHARQLLADGGAVVASIPNAAHGSVRLAVLAGRFDGLLEGGPARLFTRERIEDLFEGAGFVITHWERERAEIDSSAFLGRGPVRELLASDPESTTSRFVVRAVPSDAAAQLAAAHAELRAARSELEALRQSAEDAAGLNEELEALRRAHEERGKRLVAERLEFANELGELQRHLEALHRSRSFRYTAVFRRFFGAFRSR